MSIQKTTRRNFIRAGIGAVSLTTGFARSALIEELSQPRFLYSALLRQPGVRKWSVYTYPVYEFDKRTFDVLHMDFPVPAALYQSCVESIEQPGVNLLGGDPYFETTPDAFYIEDDEDYVTDDMSPNMHARYLIRSDT